MPGNNRMAQTVPDEHPNVLAIKALEAFRRYQRGDLELPDDWRLKGLASRLVTVARNNSWEVPDVCRSRYE